MKPADMVRSFLKLGSPHQQQPARTWFYSEVRIYL